MKYYRKPYIVEAKQFWPDKKPWPEGVLDDADPTIYWLDTGCGVVPIEPGDWVVDNGGSFILDHREVMSSDDFVVNYEPKE